MLGRRAWIFTLWLTKAHGRAFHWRLRDLSGVVMPELQALQFCTPSFIKCHFGSNYCGKSVPKNDQYLDCIRVTAKRAAFSKSRVLSFLRPGYCAMTDPSDECAGLQLNYHLLGRPTYLPANQPGGVKSRCHTLTTSLKGKCDVRISLSTCQPPGLTHVSGAVCLAGPSVGKRN